MPVLRNVALTILATLLAQHTTAALAQEKTAEDKNVADMREKCAETKEKNSPLYRLRIDGPTVENNTVNVTGPSFALGSISIKTRRAQT